MLLRRFNELLVVGQALLAAETTAGREALYPRASAVGGVLHDWNREQWAASGKRGREKGDATLPATRVLDYPVEVHGAITIK
eukprot:2355945-Alexandrium_andersonii.AAC.1